ncbi:DUF3540 domain-containing protein [Sorangium sp. So ce296]|uniref:DUF3540 domain-containing protein n=1 Tax=Sorangium cellulosum TaxID=56 RepID=A0A150TIS7_SORCE|nr:hypothetical protein BE21_45830 [Sorangium cellulosum]
MSNLARKIHIHNDDDDEPGPLADRAVQETGRVLALRDDGAVVVRTASGNHEARRAVSCLIAAEVDDLVLLARSPRDGAFVLAVLRRDPAAAKTMAVDGDLDLRLAGGRLRIAAQQGVEVAAGREVSVVAPVLRADADEGHVTVRSLSFLGDLVRAELGAVKLLAARVDSVLERLSQRVQRSYRTVVETDQLRAERIDYTAEKTVRVHGEHTLLTAEELVKVDAEQIHLG